VATTGYLSDLPAGLMPPAYADLAIARDSLPTCLAECAPLRTALIQDRGESGFRIVELADDHVLDVLPERRVRPTISSRNTGTRGRYLPRPGCSTRCRHDPTARFPGRQLHREIPASGGGQGDTGRSAGPLARAVAYIRQSAAPVRKLQGTSARTKARFPSHRTRTIPGLRLPGECARQAMPRLAPVFQGTGWWLTVRAGA
jgi:hypothetical protein